MLPITIDGKNLEVPPGITVLKAAELAGIEIPTLCHHPSLTPYGACRLCVVEVEGARTLQASCTLPVFKGMVVKTNTPRLQKAREFVLTLIFSEKNHFCMYCQKSGGDCELQNAAYHEGMTHWPIQPNWDPQKVDASSPYFIFDHNRCILCRRCVRSCAELVGNFTLSLENRGAWSRIVADAGAPMGASSCINCGSCVQNCPTGTLTDRKSAYFGKETKVDHINSICVECSVGCGIDLLVNENHLMRVDGQVGAQINNGVLCEQGRYKSIDRKGKRLTNPIIRENGIPHEATWEEAIALVGAKINSAITDGKMEAITSTRMPVEVLHAAKSIFNNASHLTSLDVASKFHQPYSLKTFGDLEKLKESDCVVCFGADLVKNNQVAGFFVKRNLPKGTTLIVVDDSSHDNQMTNIAHFTATPKAGEEPTFILGLISAIYSLGLNKEVVSKPINEPLKELCKRCDVHQDLVVTIAREVACAVKPVFIINTDLLASSTHPFIEAITDLAEITKASAVIAPAENANSVAAQRFGLMNGIEHSVKDPVVYMILGDDYEKKEALEYAKTAKFIMVQASYESEITRMADVVLPVSAWYEQNGHYMNLEGKLQKAVAAVKAPENTKSNLEVLQTIAAFHQRVLPVDWMIDLDLGTKEK